MSRASPGRCLVGDVLAELLNQSDTKAIATDSNSSPSPE